MQKRLKKLAFVWTRLIGHEDTYSMENRLYNIVCVIAITILFLLLTNSLILGLVQSAIIGFVMLAMQVVFYYYSLFKKKFNKSILLNAAVSYIALCINFFVNSGSEGPTIFIFFLTFYLIISITPNKMHIAWLGLHIGTVCILFYFEKMHPRLVSHNYPNAGDRMIDLVFTYVVSLVFTYFIIRYLRTYLDKQKKEMEAAALKLKAVFESSASCQVFLDRKMRVLYFNRGAAGFLKYGFQKAISNQMDVRQFLHSSYIESFEEKFEQALNGEQILEEKKFLNGNDESVYWQISYIPVIDGLDNIIGVSLMASDITEVKHQQENIRLKNESLMKIAHTQAHEIRMPVVNILSIMELIKIEGYQKANEYLPLMEIAVLELDNKIKSIVQQTNSARKNVNTVKNKMGYNNNP